MLRPARPPGVEAMSVDNVEMKQLGRKVVESRLRANREKFSVARAEVYCQYMYATVTECDREKLDLQCPSPVLLLLHPGLPPEQEPKQCKKPKQHLAKVNIPTIFRPVFRPVM